MDNPIQVQLVETTITGKLLGYDIITSYSNPLGVQPERVNVSCNVIEDTARLNINISCTRDEIWNISANMTGNKSMNEILQLVVAIKEEVLNTISSMAIPS
jgi:hypothetical protein